MTAEYQNELQKILAGTDFKGDVKPERRQRVSAACDYCKSSKTKCSDFRPCARCLRAGRGTTCTDSDPVTDHQVKFFQPKPASSSMLCAPKRNTATSTIMHAAPLTVCNRSGRRILWRKATDQHRPQRHPLGATASEASPNRSG